MMYLSTIIGFWHNLWNNIRHKTEVKGTDPFNNKDIKLFLRFRV